MSLVGDKERTISEPADTTLGQLAQYFPNSRKRTFEELRLRILLALAARNRTINDIAVQSGINWRTVELHLTHLLGKKLVEEIFSSQYVRIFTITPRGREVLQQIQQRIAEAFIAPIDAEVRQ